MNKISGIVQGSSRFNTVDMSKEKPVRSGAPTFGQPVATPALRQGVGTTLENVRSIYGQIHGPDGVKAKERQQAQIVREMTSKFFMQPIPEPVDEVEFSSEATELAGPGETSLPVEAQVDEGPRLDLRA